MSATPPKPPTLRIAAVTQGMRVVTPLKRIARVEGIALNTGEELHSRVLVRYLDSPAEVVALQAKLLRVYIGAPVMFPDEIESIRMRHGDRPLMAPVKASGRDE